MGRETVGLGQPFLGHRELMLVAGCQGRKTNQRSIFKSSCGHYPRSRERRSGRWGRLLGEGGGGWRLTGQRGRASIRPPSLRPVSQRDSQPSACPPSAAPPPPVCQASNSQPSKLLLPLPVARIIITRKTTKGWGCFKPCYGAILGVPPSPCQVQGRGRPCPMGMKGQFQASSEAPKGPTS